MVRSHITNELYDEKKVVYVRNTKQAMAYMAHGAKLMDLLVDKIMDRNTGEKRRMLTFVFSRDDHNALLPRWKAHELD